MPVRIMLNIPEQKKQMKIGILSDTHDLLRPEVLETLQGCDRILHGGDISSRKILDRLEQIAPVHAVRGNNDREWAESIPVFLDFELGGLRICMAHKRKDLPEDLGSYDLAVCGHTHRYESVWVEPKNGGKRTLLLNPGSCGPRLFHQPITLAVLRIGADGFNAKRIQIPHTPKDVKVNTGSGDIRKQIETVIKETERGRTVDEIARRYSMETALVEQIARLYVTHPGVTADGIMGKMGL